MSGMDVRKWNWPGYLTFGKNNSNSKTPPLPQIEVQKHEDGLKPEGEDSKEDVDKSALEDAMSDNVSIMTFQSSSVPASNDPTSEDVPPGRPAMEKTVVEETEDPRIPWLSTRVFLSAPEDPISTQPQKVAFMIVSRLVPPRYTATQ